ncbi:CvpA family protein, partial [Flavobacteriaceae bacterium]|nr:CvpA family protein [Flavobacteriaceae bacterium]
GKILTKIAKILLLGFLNKLFGGLFGAVKYILIVSFCIVFFENINSEFSLVDNKIIESTFLYNPILNFGNQLLSFLNLSANSINFFN